MFRYIIFVYDVVLFRTMTTEERRQERDGYKEKNENKAKSYTGYLKERAREMCKQKNKNSGDTYRTKMFVCFTDKVDSLHVMLHPRY